MKINWKGSEEKKSSLIVRRCWNLLDPSFRRRLWREKGSCVSVWETSWRDKVYRRPGEYLQLAGRVPYLRMIWSCVNFTKDSYCSARGGR